MSWVGVARQRAELLLDVEVEAWLGGRGCAGWCRGRGARAPSSRALGGVASRAPGDRGEDGTKLGAASGSGARAGRSSRCRCAGATGHKHGAVGFGGVVATRWGGGAAVARLGEDDAGATCSRCGLAVVVVAVSPRDVAVAEVTGASLAWRSSGAWPRCGRGWCSAAGSPLLDEDSKARDGGEGGGGAMGKRAGATAAVLL